ncbi:hypothetical protein EBT16_01890, partial [bacterium]|nr:hypothetical protein [bacterium]
PGPSAASGQVLSDSRPRPRGPDLPAGGFAKGVADFQVRYANRELKYPLVIHAEHNAILFAQRDLNNCSLIVTHHPCARCMSIIIQTGIKNVFYCEPIDQKRWGAEVTLAKSIADEAGVQVYSPADADNFSTHVGMIFHTRG